MTGVVDSHVHLLPERLALAIRAFFDQHMPPGLAYPIDHRPVLDRHLADGITTVWNLPYAHKPGIADELNRSMLAVARDLADHPVEVVSGCTVHVADDRPGEVVARAHDAGARVCKLHCSVGGYQPDDPRFDPVWAAAAERSMPVVVHAGHAVSGHTHTDELEPVGRAAARHPDCPIILAHAGHRAHRRALALLDRHANLHIDLTPVVLDAVPIEADEVVRYADRVLFGSDAPNTGIPASASLDRVRRWQLPADVEASVLGGNARRLVTAP